METPEEMKERIRNQKPIKPIPGGATGEAKTKPLEDYDPNKPKAKTKSPNEDEDKDAPKEPPPGAGLATILSYKKAKAKYDADKAAKKAGQARAMKEPAE